ncbi:unnamed protein product [Lactuca virosa]|uniref:Uncharacterized protein n=1 Tax=Lactuca virosa TaxID=75947 RepID=A0AAU9N6D3_9ASTR|nr:unnamed protein product [Lactuca virosa]
MMMKKEKDELKSGDFGTLEWNDDIIEIDEEYDSDENEDMKLDELVFKVKKIYKKLVNDKMKFGKLIEFSKTKFKESDELKEMKEIFEQEFNYKSQKEVDGNEGDIHKDPNGQNTTENKIKNQPLILKERDEPSYDSEVIEDNINILGIEDGQEVNGGKRLKNHQCMIGNSSEKVFQTKRRYVLGRGMIETMKA